MTPAQLENLPKEKIQELLTEAYTEAKDRNDAMVDVSLRVQTLTAEVYRRGILRALPDLRIEKVKLLMALGCNVHPNTGLPKLAQKIAELRAGGAEITKIEFDETLIEFRFYGAKSDVTEEVS